MNTLKTTKHLLYLICFSSALLLTAGKLVEEDVDYSSSSVIDANSIFQYFVPSQAPKTRPGLGAYLWIPPGTIKIRAVMVGIQNALPLPIMESPPIRAVCRKYDIAEILLTPHAPDLGGDCMLKDLRYDFTDPDRTAVYDHYLHALADVSGHAELVNAPIVPLAHSAYMSFPFEAAMRNPDQCLCAIPIKAGTPNVYETYLPGGSAKNPSPNYNLHNVPLLILDSAAQETVVGRWKSQPYPQIFEPNFMSSYRKDHQDNPGTTYEPRNELCGAWWEMMAGHFDMFPRDYQFVADWMEAIAAARLPEKPEDPLKVLTLKDGWLMDPKVPPAGPIPPEYAMPAPYLEFKGDRSKALWFPNANLARRLFEFQRDEMRRQVELFTVLDPAGKPIDLSETPMAAMPTVADMLHDDGQFTVTTWHYTEPPQIDTDMDHGKHPNAPKTLANVLFPGKTTLPLSGIPLQLNMNCSPLELLKKEDFIDSRGVSETRFFLRLKPDRLEPDGFGQCAPRIYDQGNDSYASTGRTVQLNWNVKFPTNATSQVITFPPIADASLLTRNIELKATSSAGVPVSYFVQHGPGIIQGNKFVTMDVPTGATKPIEVTIGACQVGVFKNPGGVRTARTVYQTFHLVP